MTEARKAEELTNQSNWDSHLLIFNIACNDLKSLQWWAKWSFSKYKSVKQLHHKMIHCFEALQSDRVSRLTWFRSGLQIMHREWLDFDLNFEVGLLIIWMICDPRSKVRIWNDGSRILIQIGTTEHESWVIWFRPEVRSGFVNHLIQIVTSEWVHKSFFWFIKQCKTSNY